MPGVEKFLAIVMALLFFGFVGGAVLIGLTAFQDSLVNTSTAYYVIDNITEFALNFAVMLPIVGTVLGALLIVAVIVVVMAGGYMAYERYGA